MQNTMGINMHYTENTPLYEPLFKILFIYSLARSCNCKFRFEMFTDTTKSYHPVIYKVINAFKQNSMYDHSIAVEYDKVFKQDIKHKYDHTNFDTQNISKCNVLFDGYFQNFKYFIDYFSEIYDIIIHVNTS